MSQTGRPSPIQPLYTGNNSNYTAQTQWRSTMPTSDHIGRPEQRPVGPQLPPLQSVAPNRPAYDNGGRAIQLPPMQLPPSGNDSPPLRSIKVSQLLSDSPSSPTRAQPASRTPQRTYQPSPATSYTQSPTIYSAHYGQYVQAPAPRIDPSAIAARYLPHTHQHDQNARAHYPPPGPHDQSRARQYSPQTSTFSSPSYTHSSPSPRSSLGPPSQQGGANPTQRPKVSQPPPHLHYDLRIRQQPVAARACGFGERDRRVIDPPPILELKITNTTTGAPETDPNAMLALNCLLLSPDGNEDETELPPAHPDMPSTRRLMGTLVASPYQAKDEAGVAGTFFVFPDLSCRSPGKYRLRFKLLRVDPMNMMVGGRHGNVATVVTDTFSVYTAKDFPGMRASSGLLKALRKQGLNVGVKKGSEARKGKGGGGGGNGKGRVSAGGGAANEESASDEEDDEEDDEESDGVGGGGRAGSGSSEGGKGSPKTQARKKGKRRKKND